MPSNNTLDELAKVKAELLKLREEISQFDTRPAWVHKYFSRQFLYRASSLGRVRSLRKRNDPEQIVAFREAVKRGYLPVDDGTLKRYDRQYLHAIGVL